jgi:hypothetical protein
MALFVTLLALLLLHRRSGRRISPAVAPLIAAGPNQPEPVAKSSKSLKGAGERRSESDTLP